MATFEARSHREHQPPQPMAQSPRLVWYRLIDEQDDAYKASAVSNPLRNVLDQFIDAMRAKNHVILSEFDALQLSVGEFCVERSQDAGSHLSRRRDRQS